MCYCITVSVNFSDLALFFISEQFRDQSRNLVQIVKMSAYYHKFSKAPNKTITFFLIFLHLLNNSSEVRKIKIYSVLLKIKTFFLQENKLLNSELSWIFLFLISPL